MPVALPNGVDTIWALAMEREPTWALTRDGRRITPRNCATDERRRASFWPCTARSSFRERDRRRMRPVPDRDRRLTLELVSTWQHDSYGGA
jgi:hypothetical protein